LLTDHRSGALGRDGRVDFAAILATQPTAYLVMSPDLVIIEAYQAFSELVGRSREELIGQYVFDTFPTSPDALDEAGATRCTHPSSGRATPASQIRCRCPLRRARPGDRGAGTPRMVADHRVGRVIPVALLRAGSRWRSGHLRTGCPRPDRPTGPAEGNPEATEQTMTSSPPRGAPGMWPPPGRSGSLSRVSVLCRWLRG
jgi:PAS domain-containing protein